MSIATIAENLRTQDNRITDNPIFMVQVKVKELGDPDNGDPHYWLDRSCDRVDEEKSAELDDAEYQDHHKDGSTTKGYHKVYYREVYQNHQPFFTEAGANEYIRINGHNLREPRVYVEGGWRNEEWRLIREHLMAQENGSRVLEAGPIAITAMNPGYRDCLDKVMEAYRAHWKELPDYPTKIKDPDDVYGFAYWLLRYSGLVQPKS